MTLLLLRKRVSSQWIRSNLRNPSSLAQLRSVLLFSALTRSNLFTKTEIRIDAVGGYYEVSSNVAVSSAGSGRKLEKAQISLNDCLACRSVPLVLFRLHGLPLLTKSCSGCITSAESVLITLQSHTEVFNFLESNTDTVSEQYRIPVISISPQSLASLAATVSSSSGKHVSLLQIFKGVQEFCKDVLGFAHVWDTTFARHLALSEHAREFRERKEGIGGLKLPMLASACPGWICYAEKTHQEMLPFISRTKSPQQVMGTLVKEWMAKRWDKTCVLCVSSEDIILSS